MLRPVALGALTVAILAGCGGGARPAADVPPGPTARLTTSQARPPASATAATLSRVPDGPSGRRRLAYVNLTALAGADTPVPAAQLAAEVLGDHTRATSGQVSVPAAHSRVPEVSAITPAATSAAQSCLGDTLAQTLLGPGSMGEDAALGAALAEGDGGLELRICAAPHFVRHLDRTVRSIRTAFPEADARHEEIGERAIVSATVPPASVAASRLLAVVAGGRPLRALGWR